MTIMTLVSIIMSKTKLRLSMTTLIIFVTKATTILEERTKQKGK